MGMGTILAAMRVDRLNTCAFLLPVLGQSRCLRSFLMSRHFFDRYTADLLLGRINQSNKTR